MDSEKLLKVLETLKSMGVNIEQDIKVGVGVGVGVTSEKVDSKDSIKSEGEASFKLGMKAIGMSTAGFESTKYLLAERVEFGIYQRYVSACNLLSTNFGDYLLALVENDADQIKKQKDKIDETFKTFWQFLGNCKEKAAEQHSAKE